MGIIISDQPSIEQTLFTALKRGKVHEAQSVLLLERMGEKMTAPTAAIVKLADGRFTVLGMHHTPNGQCAMLGYGVESGNKAVLSGLVRMGAITQADMDAHVTAILERQQQKEREWAIEQLARHCATLGIPMPSLNED